MTEAPPPETEPLRLGVSPCLLGEDVRWDGGNKRFEYLTDELGPQVHWVRVCPEVEAGLGIPREPIDLVHESAGVRMRGVESGHDFTETIAEWARHRIDALGDLDGYILKSRSPSCGLRNVKIAGAAKGSGVFAAALAARWPELPLVEETDLVDGAARERFLERARAYRRSRRGVHL